MPLCHFYRSRRGCFYGENCRNEHSRVCQFYFSNTGCKYGNLCLFEHEIRRKANLIEASEAITSIENRQDSRAFEEPQSAANLRSAVDAHQLTDEKALAFRKADLQILSMKYPNAAISDFSVQIDFSCSDPDWPFAFNEIPLEVRFPVLYPAKVLSVACLPSSILPQPVVSLLNASIEEYLEEKQKAIDESGFTVLMLRPFLRWLDRNIIDFFHRGLKQAKLNCTVQVVNSKSKSSEPEKDGADDTNDKSKLPEIFVSYRKQDGSQSIDTVREQLENMKAISNKGVSTSNAAESEYEYSSSSAEESDSELNPGNDDGTSFDIKRSGIEVLLMGFVFLSNSICTITCRKFTCMFRCSRCSSQYELALNPNCGVSRKCDKCKHNVIANFRPTILHLNSETLGYLDVDNAAPVDVNAVESQWGIMCSNCNTTTTTPGVNAGETKLTFCHQCHEKYEMQFKATKFKNLMIKGDIPPDMVKLTTGKRLERDTVKLVVGEQLPKRGTCKHYRKSYRWLRFPCCGRAYPCDVCHNDVETHECEFANRMICGFCSKEQCYQKDKSCSGCSNQLAGTTGSHWEGGRGCRNQKKMNRNDRQKYRNRNKTVAKKNVSCNKSS